MPKRNHQDGFSLIELMVAMAITAVVLAGIYGAYQDQLRTSITQQRIVDMNQNLRTATLIIERDLRMGGANPTGDAPAGITTAEADKLVIAMDDGGDDNIAGNSSNALDDDKDNDGDDVVDEGSDAQDNDGDGLYDEEDEAEWYDGDVTDQGEVVMFDLNDGNLRRRANSQGSDDPTDGTGITKWIATNIDAINFVYLDADGDVLPTPVTGGDLNDIHSVQVTIIARSGDTVPVLMRKHTDNTVYRDPREPDSVDPTVGKVILDKSAAPDQFRRQMVTTTIKCRNMGL
ncbi:putative Prepilin-type N-terminal cleavage/methylation domain-containing protein [Desulfosarcina cetonica]|uniref:PilW family protein n=1 Tax=Desulfosarcina cetonica TaxID=90730 RepID=UPI0006D05E5F|nr:prepilin-type N-terminal cleavage/methylation domain-containing protein [Desulfosarcina cetonica]VTR65338.1 putative Prepilin-type N-terminal cleavage/methylation domain-containing protein [Desulfosarcina cetonica]